MTTGGLIKLFFFSHYVRAAAEAKNVSAREIIEEEAKKYPYTMKSKFQVMKLSG